MIDFSRAQLTHFIIHYVGNKGLGEELTLSENCFEFKELNSNRGGVRKKGRK